MRKVWLNLTLAFLLLALTAGCGSDLSSSGGAQGFSNHDTARGLVLSLVSILDGLLPLGTGPYTTQYIRKYCPFDNEWFNVNYDVLSETSEPLTTVSFFTTSDNPHFILLGSATNKCKVAYDSETEIWTINLNGRSSDLHDPAISFQVDATGLIDTSTEFWGTVLMSYTLTSQRICTGQFSEDFSGTDVAITIILDENSEFGRHGQIVFNYLPSSPDLSSLSINDKPAVGQILISGTIGFDGEYLFNEDYQFDHLFSE